VEQWRSKQDPICRLRQIGTTGSLRMACMRVLPVGQIVSCHPHVADFGKVHGVLFILQVVVSMIVGR
jgi:hypothetical protein